LETERQLDWLRARGIRYVLIPWAFLDESDTLRSALVPMFRQWRADTARFRLIREFVLPRAALGSGEDRVDLLEFVDGA
ncbi:MAG TPA: hypothetical protein PKL84_06735, partial [Candidatus Hydrogenedentes bacterium]|nr:hypothetical protein [Candidatus Hydrogenedentota bacterium]